MSVNYLTVREATVTRRTDGLHLHSSTLDLPSWRCSVYSFTVF